jgi:hypothetical protein
VNISNCFKVCLESVLKVQRDLLKVDGQDESQGGSHYGATMQAMMGA